MMTETQTRQLGIEFERRVQTMIPEKEFLDKLDTETIYSFLNQYQDKYVHEIYRNLDNIPSGSKLSAHTESVLQSLINSYTYQVSGINSDKIVYPNGIADTARSITFKLPSDFYMYIRSVSNVTSTYSYKNYGNTDHTDILPNQLVSQNDVWKLVETPHNSLRILRYPAIVLGKIQNLILFTSGKFLAIDSISSWCNKYISFIPTPSKLYSLLTDIASNVCHFPSSKYAAGAEANKRRQDEARRQQAKQNKKDNEDED